LPNTRATSGGKRHDEPTELQYLANRLGHIYAEIRLIDEQGDLVKTGNAGDDMRSMARGKSYGHNIAASSIISRSSPL
jgi:hypothetical protein